MLNAIEHCLLIILLVVQIALLIYVFIINYQQHKESKKFWKMQDELNIEFLRKLDEEILNKKISDENEPNK